MASQGPLLPGTAGNNSSVGNLAWNNPDNIKVDDTSYADTSAIGTGSYYLTATNFGFTIPTGSTIDGIVVTTVGKLTSGTQDGYDLKARIIKADGSIGTTDKSSATSYISSDRTYTYGSSTDKWGETWTAENINDVDFGFALSVQCGFSGAPIGIDHVKITVYYTAGASGPANLKTYNTNAKANIKTINTNPIANVKTLNTNV